MIDRDHRPRAARTGGKFSNKAMVRFSMPSRGVASTVNAKWRLSGGEEVRAHEGSPGAIETKAARVNILRQSRAGRFAIQPGLPTRRTAALSRKAGVKRAAQSMMKTSFGNTFVVA
jgi:hypothetical protein